MQKCKEYTIIKRNTSCKQPTTFHTKLFILAIVLSVFLQFMASDYPFGIFKMFLIHYKQTYFHCRTFKSIQKKIPFIRRWNNEDTIVRKNYSPVQVSIITCDQALQWSRSFDSLLSDRSKYLS